MIATILSLSKPESDIIQSALTRAMCYNQQIPLAPAGVHAERERETTTDDSFAYAGLEWTKFN